MSHLKIAIIGAGNVGSALQRGLTRAGHDVRVVKRDPKAIGDVASWSEVIFLAVPFKAIESTATAIADKADGKPVVDVTNAIDDQYRLVIGFSTSGAEELQRKLPGARIVKAFNTVFAQHMHDGRLGSQALAAFVAGDDSAAKATVIRLGSDIGFQSVDAGPLQIARLLEPLGYLNIQLGYMMKMGTDIGVTLARA